MPCKQGRRARGNTFGLVMPIENGGGLGRALGQFSFGYIIKNPRWVAGVRTGKVFIF